MVSREEKKRKLRAQADKAMKEAEELLDDELEALLRTTRSDLERLRPKGTDAAEYERLIAAVEQATKRNESLAQLKDRLKKLGTEGVRLAGKVAKLLST